MPRPSRSGRQSTRSSNASENGAAVKSTALATAFKENDVLSLNDAFHPLEQKRSQLVQLLADLDKEGTRFFCLLARRSSTLSQSHSHHALLLRALFSLM